MTIRSHVQGYALGAPVTLYTIDLTPFDLGIVRIVPATSSRASVSFGGEIFAPHPIKTDGWELTTTGSLPRPTFQVANVSNAFTALVEEADDLHGAILTRIRTYDRYLDDGAEPDGNSHKPLDIYQLAQKTAHDEDVIAWQCSALMDQEDVALPGRIVTRDYCTHDVRYWDAVAGEFVYTNATCPYVGAPKDINGLPCAPEDEVFSKRLQTCCKARFGANAELPTRAFPGVARIRIR